MAQYRLSVGPWGDGTFHVSASSQLQAGQEGSTVRDEPPITLDDHALNSFLMNKLKLGNAQHIMRKIRDGEFFSEVVELSDSDLDAIRDQQKSSKARA
jgi:hypothetical protein